MRKQGSGYVAGARPSTVRGGSCARVSPSTGIVLPQATAAEGSVYVESMPDVQGATATPQGSLPTGMRCSTLPVPTSMTETSSEGPFAV
jgi:hypothetical protein